MAGNDDPERRARRLVARARGRWVRHRIVRLALRGLAAGSSFAAAAAAAGALLGVAPGPWLLTAIFPAALVWGNGLRGLLPGPREAALLLDRAAGTRERFVSTLEAADPEVRAFVAAQAVREPSVAGEELPISFPPTREGVAAALSTAALAAVILLAGGREGPGPEEGGTYAPAGAAVAAGPGVESGPPGEKPGPASRAGPRRAVEKLASGEDLTDEEWAALEKEGVLPADREAAREALAAGDAEAAARAVRRALAAGSSRTAPEKVGGPAGLATSWSAFERALAAPTWSPRYDEVVGSYFRGARGR